MALLPAERALAIVLALAMPALGCKSSSTTSAREPLKVAAAADLAFAFKDIGAEFEKKTGQKVTFTFHSTGLLAKQITEGAPFDIFAAANVSFADDVVKNGACYGDSKSLYARGRIVMFTSTGEPPKSVAALAEAKYVKVAIANPEHAPYGRAAKEALAKAGVWDAVKPKLVYGENVQQTLQYALSGNADVAVVALSLATVTKGGSYAEIAANEHEAIDQAMVVCKGAAASANGAPNAATDSAARRFTAYVASPEGRAIMNRYGFLLPTESMAEKR